MTLSGKRVLLTGAAGGIGREVVRELALRGARLVLVDHDPDALDDVAAATGGRGAACVRIIADLTHPDDRERVAREGAEAFGGLDVLIHLAGVNAFTPFAREDPASIERTLQVNTLAPLLLTRLLLEDLTAARGRVVFVGSIFGSIGFPWFAAYSASKFALRGFAEALRRELADTGVGVGYVAPRATRTPMNNSFEKAARELGMKFDEPAAVAAQIVAAVERSEAERYLGFPESAFVRVNAVAPRLVDRALRKQTSRLAPHAAAAADAADARATRSRPVPQPLEGARP